ncbi:MAG: LysR family transcriptional regulator [Desulfotignum sp.]|nr:LysR family transcriptional regulator [Desulfotignum sp.]
MQVDLNKLKTFYTLAQAGSYTGCAHRLFLTQSAVSHAIRKLETDLGYDLVDRSGRKFRLTREGEYLFHQCAGIFDRIDDTLDQLAAGKGQRISLTLGAPAEFGSSVLIKGMALFLKRHPHVHVDFFLDPHLLEPLLSDDLDIIVDCISHVHESLVCVPLMREEYGVIASPSYVADRRIQTISDLSRCRLLSFDKDLLWWKNFINALAGQADFGCESVIRISSVRGIINAALASMGVGFVPRYTVLKELESGQLLELFPETEVLNDQINIYMKKRNFEKPPFPELIRHIQSLRLH